MLRSRPTLISTMQMYLVRCTLTGPVLCTPCLHFHYYYCFCYYYIRTDHFLFTGLTSKIALSHSPLTAARAFPQVLLTSFKPPGYTSPCQTYVRYPRCGLQCVWAVANPSYKCPKTLECSVVHFPKMNVSGQV